MDNGIEELMNGWTKKSAHEELFSDQTEDDTLFFHEEPELGVENDNLEISDVNDPLSLEGIKSKRDHSVIESDEKPSVMQVQADEHIRLENEASQQQIRESMSAMLSLVAEHGIVHGLGLFYAENNEIMKENHGQEESS